MNQNVKTALIIGGIIVAILIALPLVFGLVSGWQGYGYGMMGPGMMGPGMMGPGMMGSFGWGWFTPIVMIIFWGLIIWGIVALIRAVASPASTDFSSRQTDSALEVLKKRYARGEMNKEEFEEKQKDLV